MKQLLIIGYTWPEPKSTGAGVRMLQLIESFVEAGYSITFASAASRTKFSFSLIDIGISEVKIELNSSSFDNWISSLNPDVVLFDRFMTEEQYGWRVADFAPNALRILDGEDLHCLRKVRQECVKKGVVFNEKMLLQSDISKREIASLYRCDMTLVISSFEMDLLQRVFDVPVTQLCYLPFMLNDVSQDNQNNFDDRKDFVSIGNFIHEPNWDSVRMLKEHYWPKIRKELPQANLLIYGAYADGKVTQLHSEKDGFIVKGRAEDVDEVLQATKVMLSPLRFGAGLKTKLLDAMRNGLPSLTTSIGGEGLCMNNEWNGFIEDEVDEFCSKAIQLYTNKDLWIDKQRLGFEIIQNSFLKKDNSARLIEKVEATKEKLSSHRANNFIGSLLLHHTLQSTKYMSRWIEEKNK